MNCSTFTLAAIVSVIYFICKFFEVKFFAKAGSDDDDDDASEVKPFKEILRDTLLVYASVWIAGFILEQFQAELGNKAVKVAPMVFTDPPNF
jgi:Na+/H+ antiporter NhaD/arsenite permease-like protein